MFFCCRQPTKQRDSTFHGCAWPSLNPRGSPDCMLRCRYGDIYPVTTAGRITIMLMMGAALLTIPRMMNKLVFILSKQSMYVRQSYHGSATTEHIVVCGALGGSSAGTCRLAVARGFVFARGLAGLLCAFFQPLAIVFPFGVCVDAPTGGANSMKGSCGIVPFFTEFFHEDHGNNNVAAVVMDKGTARGTGANAVLAFCFPPNCGGKAGKPATGHGKPAPPAL